MQEYALWEVCMRLTSGGKNKLFFDGRKMAARFFSTSKSTIYRIADSLIDKGWLIPLNGRGHKQHKDSGMYKATEYTVLTHKQWTAKHGTKQCCREPLDELPAEAPVPKIPVGPVQYVS
jgi:hypothetical protein